MKKLLVSLAAAFVTAGAAAAPASPVPAGPIYLEYTGQEQIAINGSYTYNANGAKEINWGVFVVTSMGPGNISSPNDLITKDASELPFFTNLVSGGQITGMFYGIQAGEPTLGNAFPATSGYLDLYWRDSKTYAASGKNGSPNIRCGFDCATGYTEGVLLAHLYFDSGKDAFSSTNTIVGSQVPTGVKKFEGSASAYMSVDMSKKGLWSEALDGDWFASEQGPRDLRFDNVYTTNHGWDGKTIADKNDPNILGAQMNAGSGQAYALPEPGALSLMGLALIGMGAALRRRRG